MSEEQAIASIDRDSDELKSMLQRQEALAAVAKCSVNAHDLTILALDAVKTVATICQADCYALTERSPSDGTLRRRIVKVKSSASADSEVTRALSDRHNESMSAFAIQMGQSLLVADIAAEVRFSDKVSSM